MKPMIFTLVGEDKPGLVSNLAKTVYDLDGNWLGSSFSHMAGHFAGFVEVNIPVANHDALIKQFSQHPDLKIHLLAGQSNTQEHLRQVKIEITGNDKAGIVQELTDILNRFNLNISQFDSRLESAPNWGNPLFKANALISIAEDFEIDSLTEALESVANDLMVDIEVQ
jgi:glycine cleavage system regulatory protein